MEIDLHSLIKHSQLFSSLDSDGINKLVAKFRHINVAKDKFLFRQGELSNGMYLVAKGKLIITLQTKNKEKKIFREVHPGESLGEIGALSHEPRGASAKALEDSVVAQLTHDDFFEMCHEFPKILFQTLNILEQHTRSLIELLSAHEPEKKHIALVPANKHASLKLFAQLLQTHLRKTHGITILSDFDPEFTQKYKTKAEITDLVKKINHKNEKILYVLELHDTPLATVCFDHVDVIYLVGPGNSKAYINPVVQKHIQNSEKIYKIKPELVLLYDKETRIPRGTANWLKLMDFGLQHHIRLYKESDIQRMLRFMSSQAVGLVLGGGGVRSWAHIGAIKALVEANIPIDMVCGASGGAIVAGFYALNETYEDKDNHLCELTKITNTSVSLRHLTWPAVSLFDGEIYTQKQQQTFGKSTIENLWIPFFCVSCNLAKSTAVMHRRGLLWKKIRASTSVPGIFPPVVIKGQLHLDGGIVNNLPVDLMKKFFPSISTVIAIELIHTKNGDKDYNFPAVLPLGKTILAKLKIKYTDWKFPTFVDTFLKSLLAGSSAKQNENALAADILVSPDLSDFDLLRVTDGEQQRLLDIGYQATLTALKKPLKKSTKGLPTIKGKLTRENHKTENPS
jgi:NTE family protein